MSEQCVSDMRRETDQDRPFAVSGSRKSGTSAFALKIFWPAWPPSQGSICDKIPVNGHHFELIDLLQYLVGIIGVRLLTHFNERCAPFV